MAHIPSISLFPQFATVIGAHNGPTFLDGPMKEQLKLHGDRNLEIYYAPFDYVQPNAKLVIVGITPGRVQAENALRAAHLAIRSGKDVHEAARLSLIAQVQKMTGAR